MRVSAAARRYARALFSLAQEDHHVTEIREELAQLAGLLDQSKELRRAQAELHDEASALAAELAATILRDQVQQSDRDRLLD